MVRLPSAFFNGPCDGLFEQRTHHWYFYEKRFQSCMQCEQRLNKANVISLLPSSSTSSTRPCPLMMVFLRQSILMCSSRLWSYLRQTGRVSVVVSEMQCNKCYLATAACPRSFSLVLNSANSWSSALSPVYPKPQSADGYNPRHFYV